MKPSVIALAVPFFFLLIGVELLVARLRGMKVYRLPAAFSDLGCGIVQQLCIFAWSGALVALHVGVYEHRLFDFTASPATFAFAFVAVDFFYYWWHRASHRVNALWAAHIVHHQSEDMNLAVALRQAPLTSLTISPFYLPLSLLGVPPAATALAASINTLYQFWIHTEVIGKLGPLEWVLNTPSHHRVHHGINPRYIDKNYAGIFIVWDRLFGTFALETEKPVYGVTDPLRSFDPVWAQLQPVLRLLREALRTPRVVVMPPEWTPAGKHVAREVTDETRPRFDTPAGPGRRAFALTLLIVATAGTFVVMLYRATSEPRAVFLASATIIAGLLLGALALRVRADGAGSAPAPSRS